MFGFDMNNIIDLPVLHQDGSLVSAKVSRIIELIRDYDSNLDVRWVPPGARSSGDAAFAIIEKTPDGYRTAFLVQTEEEFDERILARIYQGDSRVQGDVKICIENMQKALDAEKARKQQDMMDEAEDIARHFIRNPKHRVQIGKNEYRNL